MRFILLLLSVIFLKGISYSQISDKAEAQKFWDNNIKAIIDLDKTKILEQTNFPLEIRIGDELWSKADFSSKLEKVFTPILREELKEGSIEDIDAWVLGEDEGDTYMVVCFSEFEEYQILVLMFKQFDEVWKLYGIDLQKDEYETEEDE